VARPRKDAPPRLEVILDAAVKLLLRDGYSATSVEAISKEAGVSKATYYRHFDDKKAVLEAAVRRMASNSPLALSASEISLLQPKEALHRFAKDLMASLSRPESLGLFRLIIAEAGRSPQIGRLIFREITAVAANPLATFLREQTKVGTLSVGDPSLAAFEFIGMIKEPLFWPLLFGLKKPPVRASQTIVIDQAVRNFLKAYGTKI